MNKKILYGFLPLLLSLVVMLVPLRTKAGVFPYSVEDSTTYTPTYSIQEPMTTQQYKYTVSKIIIFNENCGILQPDKRYKFYLHHFNDISTQSNGIHAESHVDYYVLINGVRYDFGTVNYIYFDVTGINTDHFYLCADVTTTVTNIYSNSYGSAYTLIKFKDISYDMVEYADFMTSGEEQIKNSINDSINQSYVNSQLEISQSITNSQNEMNQAYTNSQAEINQSITNSQNEMNQAYVNSQLEINQSIQNTDQITNGYSDQGINNADAAFNDGAGGLSDIEDTLSTSSSQYIDNYAKSAFDDSFLDTISPSLGFVVTWFTNFWNIGGGLTATYTISFAIFIAFYIIRVRA